MSAMLTAMSPDCNVFPASPEVSASHSRRAFSPLSYRGYSNALKFEQAGFEEGR